MGNKPKHLRKGASFVKVLGRDFCKQLQLPEDFTTQKNGYVPHRFIIESSITKKCWRVEVEKDGDGRMFFRDGWTDFVKAHSLEVGNFLLFEYEEQSIFQARIYGRNGCEILLDEKRGTDQRKPQMTIHDEDEEESEALEYEPVIVKCNQQKTRSLAPRKFENGIHKRKHAVPRTYRRTSKVSVNNKNLCFSIIVHKTKKHQFYHLTVPKTVSLKMKLPSKDKVTLQDAKGICWTVALGHRRDGRALFCQGWKEFLKTNKVAPGDKLKFEFISDELVQVHVAKASGNGHQSDNQLQSSDEASGSLNMDCTRAHNNKAIEPSRAKKRLTSCESGSSFSLMWRQSCAITYLYLPKPVVQVQNLKNKDSVVLRDPEGKCWPVEVKIITGNRVVLSKGWVEFWKGHGVKAGDFLNFKFVSQYLIHVSINRGNPQLESDEDAATCLGATNNAKTAATEPKTAITREEFNAAIEPQTDISREEYDAVIEPETIITQEEFDAAIEAQT